MPLLTYHGFIEFSEPWRGRFVAEKDVDGFRYVTLGDVAGFWIKPNEVEGLSEHQMEKLRSMLIPPLVEYLESPLTEHEKKDVERRQAEFREMFGVDSFNEWN